jgi:hypothetical protein
VYLKDGLICGGLKSSKYKAIQITDVSSSGEDDGNDDCESNKTPHHSITSQADFAGKELGKGKRMACHLRKAKSGMLEATAPYLIRGRDVVARAPQ